MWLLAGPVKCNWPSVTLWSVFQYPVTIIEFRKPHDIFWLSTYLLASLIARTIFIMKTTAVYNPKGIVYKIWTKQSIKLKKILYTAKHSRENFHGFHGFLALLVFLCMFCSINVYTLSFNTKGLEMSLQTEPQTNTNRTPAL